MKTRFTAHTKENLAGAPLKLGAAALETQGAPATTAPPYGRTIVSGGAATVRAAIAPAVSIADREGQRRRTVSAPPSRRRSFLTRTQSEGKTSTIARRDRLGVHSVHSGVHSAIALIHLRFPRDVNAVHAVNAASHVMRMRGRARHGCTAVTPFTPCTNAFSLRDFREIACEQGCERCERSRRSKQLIRGVK